MNELGTLNWHQLIALVRDYSDFREISVGPVWNEILKRVDSITRKHSYSLNLKDNEIEDIVQNVMMKLQSEEFSNFLLKLRNPGGYISTIIKHKEIDLLRHKHREQLILKKLLNKEINKTNTPQSILELEESIVILKTELQKLNADERELLKKKYWENLKIAEIANQMGKNYSIVATRLFRILNKLKSQLENEKDI